MKKKLAIFLVAIIIINFNVLSYRQVKAIAVVDDAIVFLVAGLLATGGAYTMQQAINAKNDSIELGFDTSSYLDKLDDVTHSAWLKVINGIDYVETKFKVVDALAVELVKKWQTKGLGVDDSLKIMNTGLIAPAYIDLNHFENYLNLDKVLNSEISNFKYADFSISSAINLQFKKDGSDVITRFVNWNSYFGGENIIKVSGSNHAYYTVYPDGSSKANRYWDSVSPTKFDSFSFGYGYDSNGKPKFGPWEKVLVPKPVVSPWEQQGITKEEYDSNFFNQGVYEVQNYKLNDNGDGFTPSGVLGKIDLQNDSDSIDYHFVPDSALNIAPVDGKINVNTSSPDNNFATGIIADSGKVTSLDDSKPISYYPPTTSPTIPDKPITVPNVDIPDITVPDTTLPDIDIPDTGDSLIDKLKGIIIPDVSYLSGAINDIKKAFLDKLQLSFLYKFFNGFKNLKATKPNFNITMPSFMGGGTFEFIDLELIDMYKVNIYPFLRGVIWCLFFFRTFKRIPSIISGQGGSK